MRVLSLFDGISCGRVALERAGISIDTYYASEIDKYAMSISQKNYPDIIRLGDVRDIDFSQFVGNIDLIMGGSPCQDLSIAKKNRQGLSGERSGLFWKFVEAVEIIKPKYFLLENVASMSKENRDIITNTLGVEPVLINSALVSAQQRKRLYWCNWEVTQPEDKGIYLKDILEKGLAMTDKSYCLTARYDGAHFPHDFFYKQRSMIAEPIGCAFRSRNKQKQLEIRKDKKSNALTSVTSDSSVLINIAVKVINKFKQIKKINPDKSDALIAGYYKAPFNQQTTGVLTPIRLGDIGRDSQGYRIYSVRGKSVSLSANSGGFGGKTGLYQIDLPDGDYYVRKLTPLECERLQTLSDGYTGGVSNTQRYKAIGNGWTVDVIAHIFRCLK